MPSTEALNFRLKSQILGRGNVCVHILMLWETTNKDRKLFIQSTCIGCRQRTVVNCVSHSLLAMWILSAFFDTPCCWSSPLSGRLRKSVSSPPISKLASPWQGVFIAVAQGSFTGLLLMSAPGIERLIVWLWPPPSSKWNLCWWDKEQGISAALYPGLHVILLYFAQNRMTRHQASPDQCVRGARVTRIRSSETGGGAYVQDFKKRCSPL